ncbi:hypothetical protein DIPPA_15520 [Diplonema papillatum]|nr:hypothetical protein DIPPA_15520 [Diplonema papillatum]
MEDRLHGGGAGSETQWDDILLSFEELVVYCVLCGAAWVVVIVCVRVSVFKKSSRVPVLRITPDRREAAGDRESCDWLQVIVNKLYEVTVAHVSKADVLEAIAFKVNQTMNASGGKFELHEVELGDKPPQLCSVSCKPDDGENRWAFESDLFYNGSFKISFSIEYPVQLPLFGTSMFPMRVEVRSIDIQTRVRVVWDSADHFSCAPTPPDALKTILFPNPNTQSILEVSLTNIPDVSIKMSTQIGARHKITDSQVITSWLAIVAKKWLVRNFVHPNSKTYRFKLPPVVLPGFKEDVKEHDCRQGHAAADGAESAAGSHQYDSNGGASQALSGAHHREASDSLSVRSDPDEDILSVSQQGRRQQQPGNSKEGSYSARDAARAATRSPGFVPLTRNSSRASSASPIARNLANSPCLPPVPSLPVGAHRRASSQRSESPRLADDEYYSWNDTLPAQAVQAALRTASPDPPAEVPTAKLDLLRDHAVGLSKVSLLSSRALPASPLGSLSPCDLGGCAASVAQYPINTVTPTSSPAVSPGDAPFSGAPD